ncbi:Gfo/Idh/MocA family oxidoreductase [bacterium]|nr:Gfo/Idh/MocA family oxidoreductase [bacterium]
MSKVRLGLVGAGRRSRFFCQLARKLPELFEVVSVLVRDPEKRERFAQEWKVATPDSMEQLVATKPEFVIVSVPRAVAPTIIKGLFDLHMPVLSETPPAADLQGLTWLYQQTEGGRHVQVSEQFYRFPMHAARISVVESGVLGRITEAQVSAAHNYHGISPMRKLLGVYFEPAIITTRFFNGIMAVREEGGAETVEEKQTLAHFDFGDKLGIYDFCFSQYDTRIRASRVLVRGERGEICGTTVRYLDQDFKPVIVELVRHDTGNDAHLRDIYNNRICSETTNSAWSCPKDCHHEGITLGKKWVYRNPFVSTCLSDDEIAAAHGLQKMAEHVQGGPSFYSLAEASQDHYLHLMMVQAVATGKPVATEPQVWSSWLPTKE